MITITKKPKSERDLELETEADILGHLNQEQRKAVLYFKSPLLLIAGAGSGKTRVITHKIAFLVKVKKYKPRNILGVTFTNKAAGEMKQRIVDLTGIDAGKFNISTFHSLGLRILRESGTAMGFDREWQVIDDTDQKKIIERIIKSHFDYFTSEMRDSVCRKINAAKMDLNYPNNKEFLLQKGFNADEVKIFSLYYQYQKDNKLWDYEDLVSLPVKLLQTDDKIRNYYADRFRYVVVDEFQDTNPNQYDLLTLIAGEHKNITIVGDDDQAVYSWRGASIRFLFNFENDFPDTKIIKLEQNYRSTPQILDFANYLINKNTMRRKKKMWTGETTGSPVYLLKTASKEEEAAQVAQLISRLKDTGENLFPLAILYRINSQSLAFETELAKRNIGYKILKGLRFFDRKEVKDCLALLKLTVNLDDDLSFLRVVDFLPLGIGPKSLESLTTIAAEEHLSLFEALKTSAPEKYNARELFALIDNLNGKYRDNELKLSEILGRLLYRSGYRDLLEEKGDHDRLFNIEELTGFITTWEKEHPGESFTQLMDHINLDTGPSKEKGNTSVFLLTMHNAKGLEFPTVVIAGINGSYMPFFMQKDKMALEEERRLFYVACTRAIKQLIISTGSERPSQFLSGIRPVLYSIAFSLDDIVEYWGPGYKEEKIPGMMEQLRASISVEEKYIDHPIFGRGKIINDIGDDKYVVEFVNKGEKTIDTSICPVTFL
jgi:DNA helicase-2/ATP-dependent DNA helicase PcrA